MTLRRICGKRRLFWMILSTMSIVAIVVAYCGRTSCTSLRIYLTCRVKLSPTLDLTETNWFAIGPPLVNTITSAGDKEALRIGLTRVEFQTGVEWDEVD